MLSSGLSRLLRVAALAVCAPPMFGQTADTVGAIDHTSNRSQDAIHAVPVAGVESRVVRVPVTEGDDIRFEHLTRAPGLFQTRVAQIIQDDRGFLWFGTQQGIARYDGYNFRSFTHDPARSDSLSGAFVQALFQDRNGAIWVGTDQSLDKYDPATESFVHFHLGANESAHDPTVLQITEDETGMLWLATIKGLYRLNPGTGQVLHYIHDLSDSSSLSSDNVQSTSRDRAGTFWVITSAGVDAFDGAKGKVALHVPLPGFHLQSYCQSSCRWFHEDRFGLFWIAGDGIAALDLKTSQLTIYEGASSDFTGLFALLEDDEGTMWFGSAEGLLKFDRPDNRFIRYRRSLTVPTSPAENKVIALFEDREKTIWVGLGATLPDHFTRARPAFEQFQPLFDDPRNPGEDLVGAIYEDRSGGLWISANETVSRTDRKTGKRIRYHRGGTGASAIIEDSAGTMWFGAGGRGLSRLDKKTGQFTSYKHPPSDRVSPAGDYITRILIDRSGVMWANSLDGLNRFDPTTGRFTVYKRDPGKPDPYYSLIEDRNGYLWLGGLSGLVRFLPSTGRFMVFQHNPREPRSLSNNTVSTIFEDGEGVLWVGTHGGLNKLDPKKMSFEAFYKKDGLAGNIVSCILGDDRGDLWMSTNEGISSFNPRTGKFRNYSVEDGLPGNDLTGLGACYRSSSGEMFFGGFAGAIAFYPDKLSDNPYIPPVVFTDLQINHVSIGVDPGSPLKRSIIYTGDLSLSPHQSFFSIEFAALSFRNPSTNRYRYRVEGLDGDWHEVGSQQRTVNFTALPPGDYGLLVQGATSRGHWSEGTNLHITVMPPWWNTWWFQAFCGLLIILMVWSAYLYRLRQITQEFTVRLEARVSERTRLARDLHDTLLQGFQGLMLRLQALGDLLPPGEAKDELERTLDRADQVAAESRNAVQDLRLSTVITNDLAQAVRALGEQLSGENSAAFGFIVEGHSRELHPIVRDEVYRIACEALGNAFNHAQAHRVEAEIIYTENLFRLRIRDDGKGVAPAILQDGRPGHYGLPGMRERAAGIGAKLDIWSGSGTGTEVDLSVPGSIAYSKRSRRFRFLRASPKKAE